MNCETCYQQLDDFLDGALAEDERMAVEEHRAACSACEHDHQQAVALLAKLQQFVVPQPRPGFEQRMFAPLDSTADTRNGLHWFPASIGGAIAAMLVMWLSVFFQADNTQEGLQQLTIEIDTLQTKTVQLVFNSPGHFKQAMFVIELPKNLELLGYPGDRVLSWTSPLKKGRNSLALPLFATGIVTGDIVARLTQGDKSKEFRMRVKMMNKKMGQLRPNNTNNQV